jgi:predicted PurR-regulated permease PerM
MAENKARIADSTKVWWLVIVIGGGYLFHLLAPILAPFFVAVILAYLADPFADKLEAKGLSRTVSVAIVFGILSLVILVLLLVLMPLLVKQLGALISHMPEYLVLLQTVLTSWLVKMGLPADILALDNLRDTMTAYWSEVGQVVGGVMGYVSRSGMAALQVLANIILIPVLTFYLLCDWDILVSRFRALLPRKHAARVIGLSLECDSMLSAFMRGQILVMVALAIMYSVGLSLIGLELGLLLGVIAGIVSFVPYLGLIVGICLAGVAAFFQFGSWIPVAQVVAVFTFAQMIEGMVLTPRLVGDRIGLHPVVVIFAVLAGGQLFGFAGLLLALPVAAVCMVLLRHAHQRYLDSELYS